MDSATTSTNTAARAENSGRATSRAASALSQNTEKKKSTAPEPKPDDFGVTVKGRFDPDLRRFFVTILDTSSETLIVQFPSQAAARYAQQLTKAAAKFESGEEESKDKPTSERSLNQTT